MFKHPVRSLSIFPKRPSRVESRPPRVSTYKPPSLDNQAYKCAMDVLREEEQRITTEINQLKSSENSENHQKIRDLRVQLGYMNMENHHTFSNYRGSYHLT
jgi:hypothetical protein